MPLVQQATDDYNNIATAVAHILKPMKQEAVESAMKAGLDQIRVDMALQTKRIGETGLRICGGRAPGTAGMHTNARKQFIDNGR